METLVAPTINLVILLGLMVYYLRQPLIDFAKTRASTMGDDLKKVHEELQSAKVKYAEFTSKLKAFDAEVSSLHGQATQDAAAMKGRILTDAQKAGANIASDARTASVALYREFKDQLYSELGARVLDRAEQMLKERLTGDDRARIRKEFTHQVEAAR